MRLLPAAAEGLRPRAARLARAAAVLMLGLGGVAVAFQGAAAPGRALSGDLFRYAAADTDSVALGVPRLTASDTGSVATGVPALAVSDSDSVAVTPPDTLWRVRRYLDGGRDRDPVARLMPRRSRNLTRPPLGNYWTRASEVDSLFERYTVRERVGEADVRYPLVLSREEYERARLREAVETNWLDLVTQSERSRENRAGRGGLGVNIVVPGGRQSAFTTIFGKPQVDLRVTGQADIRAGFDYRRSDQQASFTGGRAAQVDPDFKQDLRLGINGTIGDKLRVTVDWDTNNQFDYENQLRLQYTGYEDEIIQSVEAGNVFLQTESRFIQSGQSLFGIKSQFQLGNLRLTTVASQEEGQSNTLSITGGAETTSFELRPTQYDEGRHFFLGYYFRNNWNRAHSEPPTVIPPAGGFNRITNMEVFVLRRGNAGDPGATAECPIVATVDLGESSRIIEDADGYTTRTAPPEIGTGRYNDALRDELRSATNIDEALRGEGLRDVDFQAGQYRSLRDSEYDYDPVLGFLSLNQRLQEGEALAVYYAYTLDGRNGEVEVGELPTNGCDGSANQDYYFMKLLKPSTLPEPTDAVNPAAWYLQLRNIYRLPTSGIQAEDFRVGIEFSPPGQTATDRLEGTAQREPLLTLLGFDRLNASSVQEPDNQFDYLEGYTINSSSGMLIFPYLEPFGDRIAELIDDPDLEEEYAFQELYHTKPTNAEQQFGDKNAFFIGGEYTGSQPAFYDLRAYAGLIEGSVRVTSGGTTLSEGSDYSVDYQNGTVTIINPVYLADGQDIAIDYEQNSFFNLQKKTLLAARADYAVGDRLLLGGTLMRLSQRSPVDKFRLGEEPVQNTIWGLDGSFAAEPRWLTRLVDRLPLVQTRAPSSIQFNAEIAQLRPGHAETIAFERTRRRLQDENADFKPDELQGVSFIDDFEGFENTFSLRQPGSWRLAAPPDSLDLVRQDDDDLVSDWRGSLAWYQVNTNLFNELGDRVEPRPETVLPRVQDIFPSRESVDPNDRIDPLDVYFNPAERGPYNLFRTDGSGLGEFLSRPEDVWGGMTVRLPDGYQDFDSKNIEFVEFVFRPYTEEGANNNDTGEEARLYLDIGKISEDVLPNGRLNAEDGLLLTLPPTDTAGSMVGEYGRLPNGFTNNQLDRPENNRTEDVGLDGLASYEGNTFPAYATEQVAFADFLERMEATSDGSPQAQAEIAKALRDPSGDDYHHYADAYFDNETFFPGGASVQQRFSRFFAGTELNGFESQNTLVQGGVQRGNSRYPDTEDLDLNSAVSTDNSYYQYVLPLSRTELDRLADPNATDDFVVDKIETDGDGEGWYLVRIPLRDFTRRVGAIDGFGSMQSMRLWTTGHQVPVTMRFATLELVGSQWRKSEEISEQDVVPGRVPDGLTRFAITSVNNEENFGSYQPPLSAVRAENRSATGTGPVALAREQSLVLQTEAFLPGQQRGAFKTYQQGLDLLKYSNLRMFAHVHGRTRSGMWLRDLPDGEGRDKLRLFVRLGSNESDDFYEFEQPLTPSDPTSTDPDVVWQVRQLFEGEIMDLNSVNIELSALNQLKVARDEQNFPLDRVFWSANADTGLAAGAPDAETFAAPGARLAIKGNPSLNRVTTITIGVRNVAGLRTDRRCEGSLGLSDGTFDGCPAAVPDPDDALEQAEVWINELRVAGYDQRSGWAGLVEGNVRLADLGDVRANFQQTTDGFGGLASTLDERDQSDQQTWGVSANVNADKLIPERYGWSIPVSLRVQRSLTQPRFAPSRGDVRVDEIVRQIEEDEELTEEEREASIEDAILASETARLTRSATVSLSKDGSEAWLLRNTVDNVRFSFSTTIGDARSPTQRFRDERSWNTSLSYDLRMDPRSVRPLWFLDEVPLLGSVSGLRFNYVPQSLQMAAAASRTTSQEQRRSAVLREDQRSPFPVAFADPIRDQQRFTHRRNYGIQYNPFGFLSLSFDADTDQNLTGIAADEYTAVSVLQDTLENGVITTPVFENATFEDVLDDPEAFGLGATLTDAQITQRVEEISRLRPRSTPQTVLRAFRGDEGFRTDEYSQGFQANYRPNLDRLGFLDFLRVSDLSYAVQYTWQNGSASQLTGASIANSVRYGASATLSPQTVWEKFGFYTRWQEAEEEARRQREQERREREQEREREREERREEERAQREAEEAGEPVEEPTAAEDDADPGDEEVIPDGQVDAEEGTASATEPVATGGAVTGADVEGDAPAEDGADLDEEDEERGLRLPLPDPKSLLRRTFLGLTSFQDVSFNYTAARQSGVNGVGFGTPGLVEVETEDGSLVDVTRVTDVAGGYTLLAGLRGDAPPLGYRFGFDRRLDNDYRLFGGDIQLQDVLRDSDQIQARTALSPLQDVQVNLNWTAEWSENQTFDYSVRTLSPGPGEVPNYTDPANYELGRTASGSNRASVWAFGASYTDLVAAQVDALAADVTADTRDPGTGQLLDDGDGRVALAPETLADDFRGAFTRSLGVIGGRGLPFPLPGWNVRYSGLGDWPIIRRLTRSASLQHGYNATYTSAYRLLTEQVSTIGEPGLPGDLEVINIGTRAIAYSSSSFRPENVAVSEAFSPLIGVDIGWKGSVQTNVSWNRTRAFTLQPMVKRVAEAVSNQISASASYRTQGLTLPFFPRLQNTLSFTLTVAHAQNQNRQFVLTQVLAEAGALENPGAYDPQRALEGESKVSVVDRNSRLTVTPTISYRFSDRIAGDFTLTYERIDSQALSTTTNINGGFNVRISISSN